MRNVWNKVVGPAGESVRATAAFAILVIPIYALILMGFTFTRDPFVDLVRGFPTWILLFTLILIIAACTYVALKVRNALHH